MKYRKKPIVIEAMLCSDLIVNARDNWSNLPEWFREAYESGVLVITPDSISILTLGGTMIAQPTDWVIWGDRGELYPCKPDIFVTTYEEEK